MKQSLDIRLGQHLTITPQLQQAIRLLQLSSLELRQEIQQALESNPLLEAEETDTTEEDTPGPEELATPETGDQDASEEDGVPESADAVEWEEFSGTGGDEEAPDIDGRNSLPVSLNSHLLWQLQMSSMSPGDQLIASALIDSIDDDGYLTCPLAEIRDLLVPQLGPDLDEAEVEAVLHQIQNFDPLGVGARSLAECLRLQLRVLPTSTPGLETALALANDAYLELLGRRDLAQLRRKLKLKPEDLQQGIALIQTLNPKPGSIMSVTHADYIVPEIIVKKHRGVWRAELNTAIIPRIRINAQYKALVQRGNPSPQNRFLQDHLQNARWFLKSLQSRNETLLKVARTIVDRQRAFFDHGPEAMKPLVLHDVAESVEMHESTISRVTTSKYMWTPRGIFELKYFFSSHVSTTDGGACSATAIRSLIKRFIEQETTSKPVSDSQIVEILEQQGINIARRTIAKYRESLNIPPSHQRKSLI
ncbi:MAG: RNA polymerase factor sigma-54 [Acidiferrobacteraceae bacterium]